MSRFKKIVKRKIKVCFMFQFCFFSVYSQISKSYVEKAHVEFNTNKNPKAALEDLKKAFSSDPSIHYNEYILAALCSISLQNQKDAFLYLHEAIKKGLVSFELIKDEPNFQVLSSTQEWNTIKREIENSRTFKEKKLYDLSKNMTSNTELNKFLVSLKSSNINSSEAYEKLKNFNEYIQPNIVGQNYLLSIKSKEFGQVPFKVYVPQNYDHKKRYPLICYLHGASNYFFHSMVSEDYLVNDHLVKQLMNTNQYIIVMPLSDRKKNFNWTLNTNTLDELSEEIIKTKEIFNINDNKVFVYGHSDGGRGAFCMLAYCPTILAGSVSYNMGPSLIFDNIYLKNVTNNKPYIVHSDLDEINPVQDVESATNLLKNENGKMYYKVYKNFHHEDKHIDIDFPNSITYINNTSRNTIKKNLYWQTDKENTGIDWIRITGLDLSQKAAEWHKNLNFKSYNKIRKIYGANTYSEEKGGALIAKYSLNKFEINTSRVSAIEILINPVMVDLTKPIIVMINGQIRISRKTDYNKEFLVENFRKNLDRSMIWINSINIKINEK